MKRFHRYAFTVAITIASRAIVFRDRALGKIGRAAHGEPDDVSVAQVQIPSGGNLLHAVYAKPATSPAKAGLLICHGIGEVVEHWSRVQRLLAANGVASLVFDYSGYGRSSGSVSWTQCELDAVNAFEYLKELAPSTHLSLLGLSLGSGVATAIVKKVAPERLFLCAAYTSFREAACAIFVPRFLLGLVPPIWNAEEALRDCTVPVVIIHGERDRLFPVQMASDLASFCVANVELIVVPNLTHNEPLYKPQLSYWGLIASRL